VRLFERRRLGRRAGCVGERRERDGFIGRRHEHVRAVPRRALPCGSDVRSDRTYGCSSRTTRARRQRDRDSAHRPAVHTTITNNVIDGSTTALDFEDGTADRYSNNARFGNTASFAGVAAPDIGAVQAP
jgi:hypothetical protein